MKKIAWILVSVLSLLVGFYPLSYFLTDMRQGFLSSKSPELLADFWWNLGFYSHIVPGGIALAVGWLQFSRSIRRKNIRLHRLLGWVYVLSVWVSATAGFVIAFFATGGLISALGFILLALIWFFSTTNAFLSIQKNNTERHERMMTYSYAACFAAVTLRIWLPLLVIALGDFLTAYRIVAWLCWVPNLPVAYLLVKSQEKNLPIKHSF